MPRRSNKIKIEPPQKKKKETEGAQVTSGLVPDASTFYTLSCMFPEEMSSSSPVTETETEAANRVTSPAPKEHEPLMNWLTYGAMDEPVPLPPPSTGGPAVCPSMDDIHELLDLDTHQTVTYTKTLRPVLSYPMYQAQYNYYHNYYQQMFSSRGYGPRYI